MSDPVSTLPTRLLARVEMACPPIVWRVNRTSVDPQVIDRCRRAGADWFIADCDAAALRCAHGRWVVGIDVQVGAAMDVARAADEMRSRFGEVVGVLLQHAESGQIKAGRAVDRVMRLRDAVGARLLLIEAADVAMAEWLVDHSPAHAVVLPYDLSDQSAGWRLLDSARELGVSLFALTADSDAPWIAPAPSMEQHLAFTAAEARIACTLVELPEGASGVDPLIAAVRQPMSPADAAGWIERYRAQHDPPARRRHGHAPDEM